MVNNLVRKVEGQAEELKVEQERREEYCKVINTLTAKSIAVEQCLEDMQKKAFPR